MKRLPKLKKCPFCQSAPYDEPVCVDANGRVGIACVCRKCRAIGPVIDYLEFEPAECDRLAIMAWNRRRPKKISETA